MVQSLEMRLDFFLFRDLSCPCQGAPVSTKTARLGSQLRREIRPAEKELSSRDAA